jgi:hypothetical protein
MSDTSPAVLPAIALICPACGYNQHGIDSPRCPECGMLIDRSPDDIKPRIPWDRRKNVSEHLSGHASRRVQAFFLTLWWTMFYPHRLLDERVRPVSLRDAKTFSRICQVIIFVPCLVITLAIQIQTQGTILTPQQQWFGTPALTETKLTLWWELGIPWMTGAQILPLMLVLPWFALGGHCGVLVWLVNRPALPTVERARMAALSHYAIGPLALFPWTCAATFAGVMIADANDWKLPGSILSQLAVVTLIAVMTLLPLVLHYKTSVVFYAHTRGGGLFKSLVAAVIVPCFWLTHLIFWYGLVPWLVGFIWVLWRSL